MKKLLLIILSALLIMGCSRLYVEPQGGNLSTISFNGFSNDQWKKTTTIVSIDGKILDAQDEGKFKFNISPGTRKIEIENIILYSKDNPIPLVTQHKSDPIEFQVSTNEHFELIMNIHVKHNQVFAQAGLSSASDSFTFADARLQPAEVANNSVANDAMNATIQTIIINSQF